MKICSTKNHSPRPKIASPMRESTDRDFAISSVIRTSRSEDMTVMPRNSTVASAPMMASVAAAFLACGRRNACTPSATASTPVSAEAPEENARSSRNSVTVATGSMGRLAVSATWHSDRHCQSPVRIVPATITTKPYVGIAKKAPASFTPRRFAAVTNATSSDAIRTLCSSREGAAEVIATVPAVTDTATVST